CQPKATIILNFTGSEANGHWACFVSDNIDKSLLAKINKTELTSPPKPSLARKDNHLKISRYSLGFPIGLAVGIAVGIGLVVGLLLTGILAPGALLGIILLGSIVTGALSGLALDSVMAEKLNNTNGVIQGPNLRNQVSPIHNQPPINQYLLNLDRESTVIITN